MLVNATPICTEEEIESMVVTMQDYAPLEEIERLHIEFLGIVSHELRAPLASIKGLTAALLSALRPLGARRDGRRFWPVLWLVQCVD